MRSLEGQVAVVTGANTGIGRVTAHELAKGGARVILACRTEAKAMPVLEAIKQQTGNQAIGFVPLDLSSLASVKACAQKLLAEEPKINLLINNAGLAGTQGLTEDGYEIAFGVNHLGHFLLTELLLPRLKESAPARIVNVASRANLKAKGIDFSVLREKTKHTTGLPEYSVSKLANVIHAKELAKRLEGTGVTTYSLHPGVVASDVWREVPAPVRWFMKLFMISNEEGAKTTLYCATDPGEAQNAGLYYDKCKVTAANPIADDQALAKKLWDYSEEAVAAYLK